MQVVSVGPHDTQYYVEDLLTWRMPPCIDIDSTVTLLVLVLVSCGIKIIYKQ
jgi:hypothetical protein